MNRLGSQPASTAPQSVCQLPVPETGAAIASADPADVWAMRLALGEAAQAAMLGEVPVGAVVVLDGVVLGTGGNRRESANDPTAHAEILALRQAAKSQASWRLCDATLVVTQEPCPMCAGALVNARIRRLVYGCPNPKAGAVRTLYRMLEDTRLNHRVFVTAGVLSDDCAALLRRFFAALRSPTESQATRDASLGEAAR